MHKLSFWRGLLSLFCGSDPAVWKLDPNSLSPSAAVPFIYWTVIYVSSYHGSIWEQSRNKASSNSFDTFLSDSSEYYSRFLLLPPVPNTRVKKTVPILVIPPSSQWHVHTSFCLFTCFPFVRLLSILVVQRILFVWKWAYRLSGETLRGLSCLMPGPFVERSQEPLRSGAETGSRGKCFQEVKVHCGSLDRSWIKTL